MVKRRDANNSIGGLSYESIVVKRRDANSSIGGLSYESIVVKKTRR